MRWIVLSIVAAISLIMLGFYVVGPNNEMEIAQKTLYWLCVVGFLAAQGFHLLSWVRKHDL